MGHKQRGFSLIELLLVVAIILIIAAIAIPNFLASRMAANESAAVQEVRAISTAQIAYVTTYATGYAANLNNLGDAGGTTATPTNACLIDSVLASGTKSGYVFTYVPLSPDSDGNYQSYSVNVSPTTFGLSGRRYFFTDQSAVIRFNLTAPAAATDSPI